MKKAALSIILFSLLWLALNPFPASAAMTEPLSVSLYDEAVYRHLIEDDDFLFIIPYSINYTTDPGTDIDEAFIFEMYDPTGVTLIGSALAYPYQNSGYGPGIVSFYFDAASGLTWEGLYIIRVLENPAHFDAPTYWDFPLALTDYSSAVTQATNQAELQTKIQDIATDLGIAWTLDLLTQSEQGIVLSSYGENYFRNSVLNLQVMCPALFSVQMAVPDFAEASWTYTVSDAFLARYNGTFIGNAMTGFAGLTSSDTTTAMNVFTLVLFAILISFEMAWTRRKSYRGYGISSRPFQATVYSATMDGFALLILMTLLGAFSMVLNGLISFMAVVVMGFALFLNKA